VRTGAIAKIRSRILALLVGLREIGVFSAPAPANPPVSERHFAGLTAWFHHMPEEDRFLLNLALTKGVSAATIREMAEQTGKSEAQVTATLIRLFARLRR
jgi:hypothetical protein